MKHGLQSILQATRQSIMAHSLLPYNNVPMPKHNVEDLTIRDLNC